MVHIQERLCVSSVVRMVVHKFMKHFEKGKKDLTIAHNGYCSEPVKGPSATEDITSTIAPSYSVDDVAYCSSVSFTVSQSLSFPSCDKLIFKVKQT